MDAARDSRRHRLGQWYTPPAVADLALALALPGGDAGARAPLRAGAPLRIVDPACGDGVFLARAVLAGIPAESLCGIELDPDAAAAARARVPGARIERGDLFALHAAAPGTEPGKHPGNYPGHYPGNYIDRFDAVVGNPPYVRQERLSRAQKQRIRRVLGQDVPGAAAADLDRLVGRGDLAAACVLRALCLARDGGRVALVVSSALLDAGYAAALWRAVACMGRVLALIDAPGERWFADAAVNAIILVMERSSRSSPPVDRGGDPVRVARLRVSTSRAAARVRSLADLDHVADVRLAAAAEPGTWARALRASGEWFAFQAAAGVALVPLGELAEVRRGVTSGANDVFYVSREHAAATGLEPDCLVPLLRSPRDHTRIAMDPASSSHVAVVCPPGADLARYPRVRRHFRGHRSAAARPTLRARDPWWALPVRPARLFLTKAYASRFVQRLASAPMVADQRVYAVAPRPGVDVDVLAGVLNSTWAAFALESLGRSSMGEGALEWTVADAAALPVLDPRRLDPAAARRVVAALEPMAQRNIDSIARERGRADRRALDQAVAAAAPAAGALLDGIWPALIAAVEQRNGRRARGLR